jgi:YHS domain-containing protein
MKTLTLLTLAVTLFAAPLAGFAAEKAKAKPYPLDTCLVSGEKLGGDSHMKPYSFVYEGQEIKLCCKDCLKDFKKDPATYLKKLSEAPKAK